MGGIKAPGGSQVGEKRGGSSALGDRGSLTPRFLRIHTFIIFVTFFWPMHLLRTITRMPVPTAISGHGICCYPTLLPAPPQQGNQHQGLQGLIQAFAHLIPREIKPRKVQ